MLRTTPIWDKMRLDGYASLVTGAGKGLGRSIASVQKADSARWARVIKTAGIKAD